MERSRREILKLFGITALALNTPPVLNAFAAEQEAGHGVEGEPFVKQGGDALKAKQWAMVINTKKFEAAEDVRPLMEACHSIHNVPDMPIKRHELKWIWSAPYHNAFPMSPSKFIVEKLEHAPVIVLCNHCENPPCVRACPTQATFKRPSDGIVLMDFHRCIGCRFCMAACPYGMRSFNWRDPRPFIDKTTYNKEFPTRMRGVVEKCNFCVERLAKGLQPACVETCGNTGAMTFGDLNDPHSEIRKVLDENFTIQRKPALGTLPSLFYII